MTNTVQHSREVMARKGFALSQTSGRSMRPLIWGGQHCVVVVPLDGEPAVGDLLMFRHQGAEGGVAKSIVHRLVEVRSECGEAVYVTRGDNCIATERVRRDDIIGRVAEVHRMSGYRPWHAIPARRFAVTDAAYRRYSRLWAATWPARRQYYRVRGHVYRLYSRIKSLFKKR